MKRIIKNIIREYVEGQNPPKGANTKPNINKMLPATMRLLPKIVSGSFTATNADELHAFQSTNGKVVGGMQTKVNKALKEVYNMGFNPTITDISITVDSKAMKTSWVVTIDESTDGKAYIGLVTVGSAGGKVGGSEKSIENTNKRALNQVEGMRTWNTGTSNYKEVKDFKNTEPNGIYIRQIFEQYTKPKSYPPH